MERLGRYARPRDDDARRAADRSPGLVQPERPRPPVAPDPRPVRDPRQRDHAAADAGRPRDRALDRPGSSAGRPSRRSPPRAPPTSCAPGRASATTGARSTSSAPRASSPRPGRSLARSRACGRCPGVGPYTASAIACFAFGAQLTTVDVNVRRVLGARSSRRTRRRPTGAPGSGTRRSSTSARRSASRASLAARVPARRGLPVARRALRAPAQAGPVRGLVPRAPGRARCATLHDGPRPASLYDAATLDGLERDGLLVVRDGLVALPEEVSR